MKIVWKKNRADCCNAEIAEVKDANAEACCDQEEAKEQDCCPPGCC